tara:strand:- start:178 stop:369 length:192 start_codon:yes stop_codon:yes gene_type:complete
MVHFVFIAFLVAKNEQVLYFTKLFDDSFFESSYEDGSTTCDADKLDVKHKYQTFENWMNTGLI